MTFEDFGKLQEQLFKECTNMVNTKGLEYAHSADRFANFNRLSEELEIPNTKIGYIFFKKHLDSIISYLKGGKEHSSESIRGRFIDAITYLTLIYGMIEDYKSSLLPDEDIWMYSDKVINNMCPAYSIRTQKSCKYLYNHAGPHVPSRHNYHIVE